MCSGAERPRQQTGEDRAKRPYGYTNDEPVHSDTSCCWICLVIQSYVFSRPVSKSTPGLMPNASARFDDSRRAATPTSPVTYLISRSLPEIWMIKFVSS